MRDHEDRDKRTETMPRHSLPHLRLWMVLLAVAVLIVAHAVILYYASSHVALPFAVISGVLLLVVVKHLGVLGSVFALFRCRAARTRRKK